MWFSFLVQNQFILENIIDIERIYNFPVEIEVCVFLNISVRLTIYFELKHWFIHLFFYIKLGTT